MTDAHSMSPEELLAETRWLRTLAATLAGPADADDLAQETWLGALAQPAARIRSLKPWLRTVLQHCIQQVRGGDAARHRREVAASRPEALPATADLAARASLQRTIVDAVLALDEPGRSTVLLRFFDDRAPAEIARLQGVSIEAVRSRLRRALATLRARLDQEVGGRDQWLVIAATGLARMAGRSGEVATTTVSSPRLWEILTMTFKTKALVAGAIVVLIAAGIGWCWTERETPVAERSANPAAAERPAASLPRAPLVEDAVAPATVAETQPASPVPVARPGVVVHLHVADDHGRDVAGATVLASSGTSASATTNARGEATLEAAGPCLAAIEVSAPGFTTATIESAALTDGARFEVAVMALGTLRIHVEDQSGRAVGGAEIELNSDWAPGPFDPPGGMRASQATDQAGDATLRDVPAIRWHAHVRARGFVDALTDLGPADATIVMIPGRDLLIHCEHATTGAPVAGVRAVVTPDDRHTIRTAAVVSDETGTIAIGRPEGATTSVMVYSEWLTEEDITVPPDKSSLTVRLSDPAPVACRLTREDQTPVQTAVLEYATPHRLIPVAAQNGSFFVEGQGRGTASEFRFLVEGGATPWRRVAPWRAEISLMVRPSIRIKGCVVDSLGQPVSGALVRIDGRPTPAVRPQPNSHVPVEVTTSTDEQGCFAALAGGDPYYLVEVATALGPCARHIVAASQVTGGPPAPFRVSLTITPAARNGVCDIGSIVVPTRAGGLRVTVTKDVPGGAEVLVTPLGALADRLSERRALLRADRHVEVGGLLEGDYGVTVGPHGSITFGIFERRVHVVADRVTEVTVTN